jgi:hypothetical protein
MIFLTLSETITLHKIDEFFILEIALSDPDT